MLTGHSDKGWALPPSLELYQRLIVSASPLMQDPAAASSGTRRRQCALFFHIHGRHSSPYINQSPGQARKAVPSAISRDIASPISLRSHSLDGKAM